MISVEKALDLIREHVKLLDVETVDLDAAYGLVLAEDVVADRDLPPFDRVMMDGVALSYESFQGGCRKFEIQNTQSAGDQGLVLSQADHCIEVMTGSVLPEGTDVVVPIEEYEKADSYVSLMEGIDLEPDQFIHRQASDEQKGAVLMSKNIILGSKELAVAASCGSFQLKVYRQPKVLIYTTGDEVVAVDETPEPWQIRRSNDRVIKAFLEANAVSGIDVLHLPDERAALSASFKNARANYDLILSSGGVSKGQKDYVRDMLEELGAEIHFHGVKQKPGKPMLFATHEKATILALPGNPMSTLSCAHYYLPEVLKGMTLRDYTKMSVSLSSELKLKAPLVNFIPASISYGDNGHVQAEPVLTQNSGDYTSVLSSDGFMVFDAGVSQFFEKGFVGEFIFWK